ncbi:winged helix-turn-helix domain-containing protein [Paraburkholderia sediminicola]|uniref:winged helix-turn-helix domain-containing protein n=1 Tax=Paraburkholderia sediminicola TaxID=458836 RepID=UPI0038B8CAAC
MKLAIMARNVALFSAICQCFKADDATCGQFDDPAALTRAIDIDSYDAILIDANLEEDELLPLLARLSTDFARRAALIVIGVPHDCPRIDQLFAAGADNVVLAPVDPRELMLRVHLTLRRFQPVQNVDADDHLEYGLYQLDRSTCTVRIGSDAIRLTSREFAIAWLLFSRPGEYISRRQIAGAVWSSSEDIVGRSLEQHIYKLRKKLELNGPHGVQLRTMYAHGYRIELAGEVMTEMPEPIPASTTARQPAVSTDNASRRIAAIANAPRRRVRAGHAVADVFASPGTQHAEIHPADSPAACNAAPWPDPAAASVADCSTSSPKVKCVRWPVATFPSRTRCVN